MSSLGVSDTLDTSRVLTSRLRSGSLNLWTGFVRTLENKAEASRNSSGHIEAMRIEKGPSLLGHERPYRVIPAVGDGWSAESQP